ncbi:MAG: hypothetical protein Kow00127_24370 [Bacteroidales bacterium]
MSRIFIIHPYELVRSGLAALARSAGFREVIPVEGTGGISESGDEPGGNDIIILPDKEQYNRFLSGDYSRPEERPFIYYLRLEDAGTTITENMIPGGVTGKEFERLLNETTSGRTGEEPGDARQLSAREQDVLKLLVLGHSAKEIADQLFISVHTVVTHRKNISEKLGIRSLSGLTVYAFLNKIIDPDSINPQELI